MSRNWPSLSVSAFSIGSRPPTLAIHSLYFHFVLVSNQLECNSACKQLFNSKSTITSSRPVGFVGNLPFTISVLIGKAVLIELACWQLINSNVIASPRRSWSSTRFNWKITIFFVINGHKLPVKGSGFLLKIYLIYGDALFS